MHDSARTPEGRARTAEGAPDRSRRSIHPGSGRRQAPSFPKGRVLLEAELAAVQAIVGAGPLERPMLIEYLHRIQDTEGCLPASHLHALAEMLKIPMAEVY